MTGQLEPIPADLLHADLLSLSYVKCGLHTGAGHHWCSWSGRNAFRRAPPDISGAAVAVSATAAAAVAAESEKPAFFFRDIVAPSVNPRPALRVVTADAPRGPGQRCSRIISGRSAAVPRRRHSEAITGRETTGRGDGEGDDWHRHHEPEYIKPPTPVVVTVCL